MGRFESFENLYNTDLNGLLTTIETERKKFLRKILLRGGVFLTVAVLCIYFLPFLNYLTGIIILFTGVRNIRKKYRLFKEEYTLLYKREVVEKLVQLADENLTYYPEYGISQETFERSRLFRQNVDRYWTEDYIEGQIGETHVYFAEVHAEKKEKDHETGNETYGNVFRGLFFVADFNKRFTSRTIVVPDLFKGRFGWFGDFLNKKMMDIGSEALIKLEDPVFEKYFSVYGTDQVEARYILSPSLMKRMIELRKKHRHFWMSFVDNEIFIAFMLQKNLFEPRIFRTVINKKRLREYLQYLMLMADVVEDLNLNNRIWMSGSDEEVEY